MPVLIDLGGDWVKVGTKIRCKEPISFDNPIVRGRPFQIPVGREAAIVSIGPGEARDEAGHPVWVDDIEPGSIVIGWFDFGTGSRNGYYTQMRGDFAHFWEPLVVAQARERPERPMILDHHPSIRPKDYAGTKVWEEGSSNRPPLREQYSEGQRRYIGFWAASSDPEADSYAQKGILLPWPEDFVDESWDPEERAMVVRFLKAGQEVEWWRGSSFCRFKCGHSMGGTDLSDGHYVWPFGFAHYVEDHGVKPPKEFINHVWRANGVMKGCFG